MPTRKAARPAGTVHVGFVDGTALDVAVLPADRMACEERFDICLQDCQEREKYTLYMLWASLVRQGIAPMMFEAWTATVQLIDAS